MIDLRQIKADKPMSIADGAPSVVDVGIPLRLPALGDYRLQARLIDAVPELGQSDLAAFALFTASHTKTLELSRLWRISRNIEKVLARSVAWADGFGGHEFLKMLNEFLDCDAELQKELESDDAEEDGKAKDWTAISLEFAMERLNLGRIEAYWLTPAAVIYRAQKAFLENRGEEQRWGKSRLDKIEEALSGEQS